MALVFAICVASPVCCCAFSHETGTTEASSCCGGGDQTSDPDHDCGCVKMTAAAEWKAQEAISCNLLELPSFATYEMISQKATPEAEETDRVHNPWIDTGPPARRRAWLQCFLI
jgi:hypothetical protein